MAFLVIRDGWSRGWHLALLGALLAGRFIALPSDASYVSGGTRGIHCTCGPSGHRSDHLDLDARVVRRSPHGDLVDRRSWVGTRLPSSCADPWLPDAASPVDGSHAPAAGLS